MKLTDIKENVVSLDARRANKEKLEATIELMDIPKPKRAELFKGFEGGKIGDIEMHEQGIFSKNGVKVAYMECGVYPYEGGAREIWVVYRDPKNPDELISERVHQRT